MTNTWERDVDQATELIKRHSEQPVEGCSDAALTEFQAEWRVALPAAYARFLAAVGSDCGDFMIGSDLAFSELPYLRDAAPALLRLDNGPPLPGDAFVFCMHQFYQFLFFQVNGDPDPPVSRYVQGDGAFLVVAPSFSSWLTDAVATGLPHLPAGNE